MINRYEPTPPDKRMANIIDRLIEYGYDISEIESEMGKYLAISNEDDRAHHRENIQGKISEEGDASITLRFLFKAYDDLYNQNYKEPELQPNQNEVNGLLLERAGLHAKRETLRTYFEIIDKHPENIKNKEKDANRELVREAIIELKKNGVDYNDIRDFVGEYLDSDIDGRKEIKDQASDRLGLKGNIDFDKLSKGVDGLYKENFTQEKAFELGTDKAHRMAGAKAQMAVEGVHDTILQGLYREASKEIKGIEGGSKQNPSGGVQRATSGFIKFNKNGAEAPPMP